MSKMFITLIESQGKYYIMCDRQGVVQADQSLVDAIRYFEDGYNQAHRMGGSWSASATMNWLFLQPSIIQVLGDTQEEQLAWIDQNLVERHPETKKLQFSRIGSVGGTMVGMHCRPEAEKFWGEGEKPRLIS